MAITLVDATSYAVASRASTETPTFTLSAGVDLVVFGMVVGTNASDITGTPTWNGTNLISIQHTATVPDLYLYYLLAPATGTKTLSVSFTHSGNPFIAFMKSFSGSKQSGQPDASGKDTSGSAPTDIALTASASGDLGIGLWNANGSVTMTSSNLIGISSSSTIATSAMGYVILSGSGSQTINMNNNGSAGQNAIASLFLAKFVPGPAFLLNFV